MMAGTPARMMVLVTGCTRIWALSGTCLMQTTMCMVGEGVSELEAVADARLGENVTRLGWVGFNLLAQMADIDPEVLMATHRLGAPDLGEQLAVSHHSARMRCQAKQQAVFDLGQMDNLAPAPHHASDAVDFKVAEMDQRLFLLVFGSAATHQGTDSRQQFRNAEWLGQIVVGAGIERCHLLGLQRACRKNQDGHGGPSPIIPDEFDPVLIWQTEIEHDQAGLAQPQFNAGLAGGTGHRNAVALALQGRGNELPDVPVVLDHQNPHVFAHASASSSATWGGSPIGRRNVKQAPPSLRLSASTRPPCASTIVLTTARPRPTPGMFDSRWPRRNRPKISAPLPSGKPGPRSRTSISSQLFICRADRSIPVPGRLYLAAFSRRLQSARSINTASISIGGSDGMISTLMGCPSSCSRIC